MTECNRKSLSISSLERKKIIANLDGGRLTTDAGGLLLREVDRWLGLTASLPGCTADPRDPIRITHDLRTLLAQRVFGITLGYEDLNDHATLRDDPLFAILAGQRPDHVARMPIRHRLFGRPDDYPVRRRLREDHPPAHQTQGLSRQSQGSESDT